MKGSLRQQIADTALMAERTAHDLPEGPAQVILMCRDTVLCLAMLMDALEIMDVQFERQGEELTRLTTTYSDGRLAVRTVGSGRVVRLLQ